MPDQAPIIPPPNKMVRAINTPDHTTAFFSELVDRTSHRYQQLSPIKRGTKYVDCLGGDIRTIEAYPDLFFCKEFVPLGGGDIRSMPGDTYVIWYWSTPEDASDSYNAEISYLADAVTNPVFARVYTTRRDEYEAAPTIATGLPLTALIGVKMTNGGDGYKNAKAEFDCYGEDAEVEFVISEGKIISAIVTKEGSGFNAGSVINIIGDGSGATCVPIIQPVEAVLTSQKKSELDDGDPMSHEYVKVLRVYELLPGPWVPFTRYDDDLGPIQGRRRALLNTGQTGGVITATSKTNYEGRDGSSVVLIEIQENWSDGTGVPGPGGPNPIYPILFWSTYSDERGTVQHTSQIKVSQFSGNVATLVRPGGGKIVKTWEEPYADNPFLVKVFTESWTEVVIGDYKISSEFGGGIIAVTETTDEPGVQGLDFGLTVLESRLTTKSPDEQTKHNEFLASETAWPILTGFHTDEVTGIVTNFTKQVVAAGIASPPRSGCRGPFVEMQTYDRWRSIQIVSAIDPSSLPPPEEWLTTRPFNLPPTLLSIEAIWSDFVGKTASSTQNDNGLGITSVEVHSGSKAGVVVRSRAGFRGYARTKVKREYFPCRPDQSLIALPQVILPSSGSVIITDTDSVTSRSRNDNELGSTSNSQFGASSNNGGSVGDNFSSQVQAIQINEHLVGTPSLLDSGPGPALHPGKYLVVNSTHTSPSLPSGVLATSPAGNFIQVFAFGTPSMISVQILPSYPMNFAVDQPIITEVEVTEWRFGVFVMTTYTVLNPYAT